MRNTLRTEEVSPLLYRNIVEQAKEAIIAFDMRNRILLWNTAAEQLFGHSQADALGKSPDKLFIPPTQQSCWFSHLKRLASGPISDVQMTMHAIRKDGRILPVNITLTQSPGPISPLFTAFIAPVETNSEPVQVQTPPKTVMERYHHAVSAEWQKKESILYETIDDILSEQDANTSLQLSLDRLAQLFDADWCAIWFVDSDTGLLQQPNLAYFKTPDDIGHPLPTPPVTNQFETHHIPDLDAQTALSEFEQQLLKKGVSSYVHIPIRCPLIFSGILGIHSKKPNPWDAADIELMKCLAGTMVITLRKNDFLRNVQQSQQELLEYAARLSKSNEELEHFATIASHDLQEPLRKVLLFSDHLYKTEAHRLSQEGLDDLNKIQLAIDRMQHLINDLLDLSKVTRRGSSFQTIDLRTLVQEAITSLDYVYNDIQARVQLQGNMKIEGDYNQIRQMMIQLLDNALKFHKPETPSQVVITIQPQQNNQCRIDVRDNGLGMKAEHLDKIFEVFFRLHHSVQFPGTGIGLAIVKKIVERHNGNIAVTSSPGEGSVFTVRLPSTHEKPVN